MKKKQLNKKKKLIIIVSLIILVLGVSTCTGIYLYNKNQESKQEEPIIKKSPYTLEEIYEIVEDYEEFEKLKNNRENQFAYTIVHFYDYFNKSTPFKIVKLARDKDGNIIKKEGKSQIESIKYINYYEFQNMAESYYKNEQVPLERCETKKTKPHLCSFAYSTYAEWFVYLLNS